MAQLRSLPQNVSPAAGNCTSPIPASACYFSSSEPLATTTIRSQMDRPKRFPPGALSVYFDALFLAHGPQHWWPGRTRFEIIVGAILTQNTAWKNVARAIRNLRHARLLTADAIRRIRADRLARLL